MASSSCTKELPSDLVFNILTRTSSLQALDTCKVLSKEWQQMLYSSRFLRTNSQRTENVYGFFLQEYHQDRGTVSKFVAMNQSQTLPINIPLASQPWYDITILASCQQGILCCEPRIFISHRCRQYYVCKPATGQCIDLPNPVMNYHYNVGVAIMVVQSTNYLCYKIVRLSRNKSEFGVEIFNSKHWTWSEMEKLVLNYGDSIMSEIVVSLRNVQLYGLKQAGFYGSEIAVFKKFGGLVIYNLQDGSHSIVKVEFSEEPEAFQFRSDSELVNLRSPWLPQVRSNISQSKK